MQNIVKPGLIVLPLRFEKGEAYDGIGQGIHFLPGNVVALKHRINRLKNWQVPVATRTSLVRESNKK